MISIVIHQLHALVLRIDGAAAIQKCCVEGVRIRRDAFLLGESALRPDLEEKEHDGVDNSFVNTCFMFQQTYLECIYRRHRVLSPRDRASSSVCLRKVLNGRTAA